MDPFSLSQKPKYTLPLPVWQPTKERALLFYPPSSKYSASEIKSESESEYESESESKPESESESESISESEFESESESE